MPQASPGLQAKWRTDRNAESHLKEKGYRLRRDWFWEHDTIKRLEDMDPEAFSAMVYLAHEWDYGGLATD